jgi:hypothetical protein
MVIYIAHITPRHNAEATRARSGVGYPKGVSVVCSQDFIPNEIAPPPQADARRPYPNRDVALTDADFFLVLLPPTDDLSEAFSIGVELGQYMRICTEKDRPPQILCLHHPDVSPLQIENHWCSAPVALVPAKEPDVTGLIQRIYSNENVSVLNDKGTVARIVTDLLASVHAVLPTKRYTTAATLTVTITEKDLPDLAKGILPPSAAVGGFLWEKLLGLPEHTAGLPWSEVQNCLEDAAGWEPILAEELDVVRGKKSQQNVVPILLKQELTGVPAGAVVQKYEVYPAIEAGQNQDDISASQHRFSLVAFRSPLLFDPKDRRPIATAFHLAGVAQLFRFTVVDNDLKNLQNVNALAPHRDKISDFEGRKRSVIADLRRHMLLIDVECRRRGFLERVADFNHLVLSAFQITAEMDTDSYEEQAHPKNAPPNDEVDEQRRGAEKKQKRLRGIMTDCWSPVRERLNAQLAGENATLDSTIKSIEELAAMNAEVIQISAECYWKLVVREYGA